MVIFLFFNCTIYFIFYVFCLFLDIFCSIYQLIFIICIQGVLHLINSQWISLFISTCSVFHCLQLRGGGGGRVSKFPAGENFLLASAFLYFTCIHQIPIVFPWHLLTEFFTEHSLCCEYFCYYFLSTALQRIFSIFAVQIFSLISPEKAAMNLLKLVISY